MTAMAPSRGTFAGDIARAWTRLYTVGLPEVVRERRAQELESDLWEHEADRFGEQTAPALVGVEVLGRMIRGMPADLLWRFQLEGPQMELKIPFERIVGLMLVALVVVIPIAVGIDGYDTSRDSWPNELSRLADLSTTATRANMLFQVFSGVSLIGAAAGFYLTLEPRAKNLATLAAFGLAAAGILTLAASAMYGMVSTLADDYLAGRGGDDILVTSRALAIGMQSFAASAGLLLIVSVFVLAFAANRHALVPSPLRWLALASALLLAGAIVTAVVSDSDNSWYLFMSGAMLLLLWLLVAGASLLLGFKGNSKIGSPLNVNPA